MFLDLLYRLFRNIYRLSSFDPIAWAENFLPNHIVFCLLDFFQSSSSWCSFVTENKEKIIYVTILIHRKWPHPSAKFSLKDFECYMGNIVKLFVSNPRRPIVQMRPKL